MSEEKLDFSLPGRGETGPRRKGGALTVLVLIAILLAGADLALTLTGGGPGTGMGSAGATSSFSPETLRELALRMEQQGLHGTAAAAWIEYLEASAPDEEQAAAIWYRIGKLHQDGEAFEAALDAYYRSESLHKDSGLASEIGRRAQESLEALGKFAALKHELAQRVSLDEASANQGGEVIAEIGAQKITRTELDQQIEANIENQLARFAAQMPEEDRKRQKEAMLKQFTNDQQRMQFLNAYIVQEILYRKARESKLTEDAKVRARLRDVERGLLAEEMMATELAGQINITDGDLQTFYEANKPQFVEPERARISQILLAGEEEARELIAEAPDASKFAELAGERSLDAATKEKGGEVEGWVAKGGAVPGIGPSEEAPAGIFSTEAGNLLSDPVKTSEGYHVVLVRERAPERQRPFEEVQREVYQALRGRKESEVQAKLVRELQDEYDVVIHQDQFKLRDETE